MRRALKSLLLLLGLAAGLPAQPPRPPPAPEPGEQEEEFRVRVEVELVSAPLVVRDARGEFVYDLTREEVTLLDNGIPQQLTSFELTSQPVSLVILLDTSQRIAPLLERVRKSGILFTSYILGQFGEAAVITFDDSVTLRQEFTADTDTIIETLGGIHASGTDVRLADALDHAVALLLERPEERRRVIVAITQPHDEGSSIPIGVPLRRAQLLGISVYTVALSALEADLRRRPEEMPVQQSPYPPGVFPRPGVPGSVQTPTTEAQQQYARVDLLNAVMTLVSTLRDTTGKDVLELYAQGTGGVHYAPRGQRGLERAINQIGQDLHNQYLVSYRPSNRDRQGFHRIEVRVGRPGVRIRTRAGYYVGPPL